MYRRISHLIFSYRYFVLYSLILFFFVLSDENLLLLLCAEFRHPQNSRICHSDSKIYLCILCEVRFLLLHVIIKLTKYNVLPVTKTMLICCALGFALPYRKTFNYQDVHVEY